jgi:hypothetical protein
MQTLILPAICLAETPCIIQHLRIAVKEIGSMGQLRRWVDSPIIAHTFRRKCGSAKGVSVRLFLGVAVIAVGVANLCLQHRWHRVLGVVAIAVGLVLCALVWVR